MLSPPGGPLVMQRAAQGDGPSGMFLAGGIAAALFERGAPGRAVVVDVSLLAGAVWTLSPDIVASSVLGTDPPKMDPSRPQMGPLIGSYLTADDRWLMLSMLDGAKYWDQACRVLTFDDWVGHPEHNTPDQRPSLTETIATRPIDEWAARLRAEGCIFSKMATPLEVLDDVQVQTLDYVPRHPTHATGRLASSPVQFDDEPVVMTRGVPDVGEHTREILAELGLAETELDALAADGVIAERRERKWRQAVPTAPAPAPRSPSRIGRAGATACSASNGATPAATSCTRPAPVCPRCHGRALDVHRGLRRARP